LVHDTRQKFGGLTIDLIWFTTQTIDLTRKTTLWRRRENEGAHIVVVEKEFGGLPATGEGIWWHHRDEI
jgi:hypothetical protein